MCRDSGGVSSIEELLTETSSSSNTKLDEVIGNTSLSKPHTFADLLRENTVSSEIGLKQSDATLVSAIPSVSSSLAWKSLVNVNGPCLLRAFYASVFTDGRYGDSHYLFLRFIYDDQEYKTFVPNNFLAQANMYNCIFEFTVATDNPPSGVMPANGSTFSQRLNEVYREKPVYFDSLKIDYALYAVQNSGMTIREASSKISFTYELI